MSVNLKSTTQDGLRILSFNATSIRGKLREFNSHFDALSHDTEFDVISLSETWLNDSVFDAEILFNSDYNVFRRDRDLSVSKKKDGGGVLTAVSSKFPSKRRVDLESNIEILWVECKVAKDRKVFIGTVYLPPDSRVSDVVALEESFDRLRLSVGQNDSVVILGDFNMSDASWKLDYDKFAICDNQPDVCSYTSLFLDVISSNDFCQHNVLPTFKCKPLDLVITNKLSVSVDYSVNPVSSTHRSLEVFVTFPCKSNAHVVQCSTYNFKKADFGEIRRLLSLVCWSQLISYVDVNVALSNFYDIIFAILTDCVPLVKFKYSKFPCWYSKELISVIKEKERVRKLFVKTGRAKDSEEYKKFCALRCEVKTMQKYCHASYVKHVSQDIKNNPKRFWSYVKSQKKSSTIPNVVTYKDCEHSTLREIAQAFCRYFESVFIVDSGSNVLPESNARDVPMFRLPVVSAEQMKVEILALDRGVSSGYGNVPVIFLMECAEELCIPLSRIFNISVSQGEFPTLLKFNNIVPIYKSDGDRSRVESYRPISIQPVISKLFERIVNRALRCHIGQLICDQQHGFVPAKSTTTNLLCYKNFISSAFDDGVQVHSVYTDLHKAFDTVSHQLLILKMRDNFGVCGKELQWFHSYLSERHQRVVLSGVESDWIPVSSGVPQGSILGPSLFLMYINDLPQCFRNSQCLLFADDVKVFKRISNINDCREFQDDLNMLFQWCSKWKMDFNFRKCFFINFSLKRKLNIVCNYFLGGNPLQQVFQVKDLGVHFTHKLSFSLHMCKTVNKAFRMLGFVKRTLKPFGSVTVFKVLYNAYVRSNLDYCSSVWSPNASSFVTKIERVQKKFVKHLCYLSKVDYHNDNYVALCNIFQLTTLERRREITDLMLFHKLLHSKVNCSELLSSVYFNVPSRRTRHTEVFTTKKKCRLGIRKADFIPRCVSKVNILEHTDFFNCKLTKVRITHALNDSL